MPRLAAIAVVVDQAAAVRAWVLFDLAISPDRRPRSGRTAVATRRAPVTPAWVGQVRHRGR